MAVQPEHFASSRDRDVARTDQSWPALDQAQQFFAVQTTPCLLAQLLAPAGQQHRRHWLTDSGLMGPGWPHELASHGLNSQSLWHDQARPSDATTSMGHPHCGEAMQPGVQKQKSRWNSTAFNALARLAGIEPTTLGFGAHAIAA